MVATASPIPRREVQRARLMGDDLDGQPGGVGEETARREMVETDAVLEVSDGILDLGVAVIDMPEVGLETQGLPVPVGDEGVIAVVGEQRQLGTGGWLHSPDAEPRWRGVGLTLEGCVVGFGHSAAPSIQ